MVWNVNTSSTTVNNIKVQVYKGIEYIPHSSDEHNANFHMPPVAPFTNMV